jgi:hypothetical protein
VESHSILKDVTDVRNIVRIAKNGVFELLDSELNEKLKLYFVGREDDGF